MSWAAADCTPPSTPAKDANSSSSMSTSVDASSDVNERAPDLNTSADSTGNLTSQALNPSSSTTTTTSGAHRSNDANDRAGKLGDMNDSGGGGGGGVAISAASSGRSNSISEEDEKAMELAAVEIDNSMVGTLHPYYDKDTIDIMLAQESQYIPGLVLSEAADDHINVRNRRILIEWVREVSEDILGDRSLFLTTLNYIDRFLALVPATTKSQLQLLGAVCLLIAAKTKTSHRLEASWLATMTEATVRDQDILAWELLVLGLLRWDMLSVIATDYTYHVLNRLRPLLVMYLKHRTGKVIECELGDGTGHNRAGILGAIQVHADTMMADCVVEKQFINLKPSVVAAVCIAAVVLGLFRSRNLDADRQSPYYRKLLAQLNQILAADVDVIEQYVSFGEIQSCLQRMPRLHL